MKRNLISFLQINFSKLNLLWLLHLIIAFSSKSALSQEKEFVLGFSGTPHQTCSFIDTNLYCPYWLHYHWFDEFKLNLWQGWNAGSNLQYHLTSLDSLEHYGMQGYYQPDSLIYAAYGKVSIHEADSVSDRYRYNNHHNRGADITDNWQGQTQRVRFYEAIPSGPYTSVPILTELNENAENSYSGVVFDPIYQPIINDNGVLAVNNYYIKPRMRISTSDAFGDEKPVIKLVAFAFDGSPIDTITLTTKDFRYVNDNTYDGRYLEDYFISNIMVKGDALNAGRVGGFLEWGNINLCEVDYQIYWYQEVSVWIDYVKIMDEPANQLFNNQFFRDRLKHKVKTLLDYDGTVPNIKGFYTEETDFARLTCLKYLQDF